MLWCPKGDFPFLSWLLHLLIRILLCRKLSSLLHLFLITYSFISVWTRGYLFYSIGHNTMTLIYILLLKPFQLWPLGALSYWLLCFFNVPHPFLTFWHWKTLQDHLVFPCPYLGLNYFPRNLGSFNWKTVFRNQDLCSRCAHCYRDVIASRTS